MQTLIKISSLLCILFLFCQCRTNKDTYLNDFEKFIVKTEKSIETITDAEWTKIMVTYDKYTGEYYNRYKEEFSDDEKIKIGFLKEKFSSLAFKREIDKLKNSINNAMK